MLKGLAITPPVVGRISIGRTTEKNGVRLPQKDDQFTITTQIQSPEGWILHPMNEQLRKDSGEAKLRRIPIRLLFNEPELNFRADYSLFDRNTGRPMCVGNGETCKRITKEGLQTLPCPGADLCPLAKGNACKPYGRLNVLIGDADSMESFVFRTTGFNSIRTLIARLHYFKALSNDRLSCLPLELRLRGKSTRMSFGQPIFYADITLREGMTLEETLEAAKQLDEQRQAAGFNQQALDEAARNCLNNGTFEDDEDDAQAIVEEFYPLPQDSTSDRSERPTAGTGKLAEKLEQKVRQQTKHEGQEEQA